MKRQMLEARGRVDARATGQDRCLCTGAVRRYTVLGGRFLDVLKVSCSYTCVISHSETLTLSLVLLSQIVPSQVPP